MEDSLTKSNKANEYVDVALRNYKYHNVPIVTVIELQIFLKQHKGVDAKCFLRQEIQFQGVTHQRDSNEIADFFLKKLYDTESTGE